MEPSDRDTIHGQPSRPSGVTHSAETFLCETFQHFIVARLIRERLRSSLSSSQTLTLAYPGSDCALTPENGSYFSKPCICASEETRGSM
uniref:Uncharacterized protein n=1 Tax=Steinernema glaseri TaxID=37863 RepID=A0A1I8A129_9BILA